MINANVTNIPRFAHAYQQAPWRVQRQWVGAFLLAVLALAMVAALYLDVTARAAITGREIQDLQLQIASIQRTNADLQTRLATSLSTSNMASRAFTLGFRPAEAGEIHYLIVPGFYRPSAVMLVSSAPQSVTQTLPPEYSESLFDWFADLLGQPATGLAGVTP